MSSEQTADDLQAAAGIDRKDQAAPPAATLFDQGSQVSAPIIQRTQLKAGEVLPGPLLVVEEQTTTVVPSDFALTLLTDGTLSLQYAGE